MMADIERIMTADYLHTVADELFTLTGDSDHDDQFALYIEGLAAELAEIADVIEEGEIPDAVRT